MDLDRRVCDRARRSRDARFDGRFFIAVTSTGVYCRPICPARAPKDANVRYFPTAAAAEAAGFRPCLRCRPEASPGTPAWLGTGLVSRALRLIGDGALDDAGVDALADRLGITARHLRRVFLQHLGATPLDVAQTRRVHFAKKLLDETSLAVHQVAFAAGYGSLRRFNSQIRSTFSRTPTELRRLARKRIAAEPGSYRFRLSYRPPYDWDGVLAFLRARATPGVERVEGSAYIRIITVGDQHGWIEVTRSDDRAALALDVHIGEPRALLTVVERVRRMFDLGADPIVIGEHLGADPLLRPLVARHPGARMPGAWEPFEIAVRAIVGQQISVAGATTVIGRISTMFGSPIDQCRGLDRIFPTPAQLAEADVERAGVMPSRAETSRALARGVASGALRLDPGAGREEAIALLTAVHGIGRWTAEYIAMRALGQPDAFPSGDLVLRRMTGAGSTGELERRAEAWRPWRAYAVMLLWRAAASKSKNRDSGKPGMTGKMGNAQTMARPRVRVGGDRTVRFSAGDRAT
jgi:AraC family transcriptional regulator, regulatory protein of adaptative response / DNA-3-methyladenine glycosylase II